MPLYEHVVIARQDISPQQVETLNDSMKSIIEEGGGKVAKTEYWGLRTLTYRIKKNRKGHYTLMNIDSPHAAVAEMERQLGLNEDVLRFKTFRVEELEEGESAMMRKGGRDDRRGGRDDRPRRDGGFRKDGGDRPKEGTTEKTGDES